MSQQPITINCIYDISLSFINTCNFKEIKHLPSFEAFIAVSKSKEEIHPVCYDSFNYINCLLDIGDTSIDIIKKNFNTKLIIEDSYLDVMFTKNAENLFSAHLILVIKKIRQELLVNASKHKQEDIIISHKKKVVNANNVLTNETVCELFKQKIFEYIQERINNNNNKYNYFPHWLINKYNFKVNNIVYSNYEIENCLFGYESIENKFRLVMTHINTIKNIKCIEKYIIVSLNENPMPVEIEPSKVDHVKVFQQHSYDNEVVKRLYVNELEVMNKFEHLGELRQKYLDG